MANFSKFTSTQKGAIMRHVERQNRDYSNKNIDHDRTSQNYSLIDRENPLQYTNDRIEQSTHLTRANIVQLVGFTLTLPKDYDGNSRDFFEHTHEFIEKDFGRDNIAYSEVHMDETTPHIHIGIIPITNDNRLCAKDLINRDYLRSFHDRLQEHIREREPDRTINLYSENKQREHNLPMHEYQVQQKEKELQERAVVVREQSREFNAIAKYINEKAKIVDRAYEYQERVEQYCHDRGMSEYQYYNHEFWADRGTQSHQEPELYNYERSREEREEIARDLQEPERDKDRDRDR